MYVAHRNLPLRTHSFPTRRSSDLARCIAAAHPAFFKIGDIAHTVLLGEVIRRGQTMAAATHDAHIVFAPGLGTAPGPLPVPVIGKPIADKTENGISDHVSISITSRSRQDSCPRFPFIWISCLRQSPSLVCSPFCVKH